MTNVQVAVWFGRKTCADFGKVYLAAGLMRGIPWAASPFFGRVFVFSEVFINDGADKV